MSRISTRAVARTGVSLAALTAALAVSAPALAQEREVEELVVTGFRASLAGAVEVKRAETAIVDVIKAEDIADFPDNNLAESIQRIPGVAIDREAGEGRSISVRGLGPDFTRVRLNGIEALATTGGPDSGAGTNRGRGFDFNIFASELFQSITVRKTQAAEVEEGSLGATVDLQTSRPFDYKDFTFAASAQMGYNELAKEYDPRVAFLVSDTWLDGRLGALVSVAYTKRNVREEGYNSTRWDNGPSVQGFCSPVGVTPQNRPNSTAIGATAANCATGVPRPAATPENIAAYQLASAATTFHPRLPAYSRNDYENDRLGVTAAIQFKPTDRTNVNLDILLAKLDTVRQDTGLSAISFSRDSTVGGKPQTHVLAAEVDENGQLVYGRFDNVDFRTSSTYSDISTEFTQWTLSVDHEFNDRFRVSLVAGRAFSDFDNPIQTHVTFERQNVDGFSFDYRDNARMPEMVLGFDPADPAQWAVTPAGTANALLTEVRLRPQGVENVLETGRVDFAFDAFDGLTFKWGAALKKYDFFTYEQRRQNQTDSVTSLPAGVTLASLSSTLSGFGSGLPAGAPGRWIVPNVEAFAQAYNIYCNCNGPAPGGAADDPDDFRLTGPTNGDARRLNQVINEDDLSLYGQASFRFDNLFGRTLRGDLGARYVETELMAQGYQSRNSGTLVTVVNKYNDLLPSVNLAYDVRDDLVLRFGAAKVMARPTLTSLNPGGSTTTSNRSNPSANLGNPFLKPFRATTYDVSAEWYFAPESLLSFAFFYKDISTYIQNLRIDDIPFSQGPLAGQEATIVPSNYDGTELWDFTTFINTPGGPLKGFEIAYQQPFTFLPERFGLPEWTGNFGALLNYTRVKSEISYATSTAGTAYVKNDLLNLSKSSYNATLYYEDERLSARVSAAYRDGYLTRIPGQNNNDVEGKNETFNVDVSVSYAINDNFSLTFEGLNLTDEYNDRYVDSVRNSPSTYIHSGRQYYAGVRYRF
ncbi:TonB-dependent receptor [Phenylobacterium sp.]|uniref:TonB-dependent receptor n=1 Tax=Phenylobacterium sp. TaxID=1871053 RepID=UPI002F93B37B